MDDKKNRILRTQGKTLIWNLFRRWSRATRTDVKAISLSCKGVVTTLNVRLNEPILFRSFARMPPNSFGQNNSLRHLVMKPFLLVSFRYLNFPFFSLPVSFSGSLWIYHCPCLSDRPPLSWKQTLVSQIISCFFFRKRTWNGTTKYNFQQCRHRTLRLQWSSSPGRNHWPNDQWGLENSDANWNCTKEETSTA